jgi:hypothetical protein
VRFVLENGLRAQSDHNESPVWKIAASPGPTMRRSRCPSNSRTGPPTPVPLPSNVGAGAGSTRSIPVTVSRMESHLTKRDLICVVVVGSLLGCASSSAPEPAENPASLRMFAAAISLPQDPNRVALGRLLFHETRLSKNREISCSTCHVLTKFGIDGKVVSTGVAGRHGTRNAPTVFNAATHIAQFWDGRAPMSRHRRSAQS